MNRKTHVACNFNYLFETEGRHLLQAFSNVIFTARRYVSAAYYAVIVCPSVTSRHCTKMAKHRITQI